MSFLRRVDAFWNVVLFPMETCAFDFAKLSVGDLTGILDLKSRSCVEILRQNETFVRVKCSDLTTKRQVLSWATRSTAAAQFAIRIKEDLLKFEREQKAKMWSTMQALYHGGLRPSWDRSSITYKLDTQRFYIHPDELPEGLTPDEVLKFARTRTLPPACTTKTTKQVPAAQVLAPHQGRSSPDAESPCQAKDKLITALQQDLHLMKVARAKNGIQCCLLQQKLKALKLKYQDFEDQANPPKLYKTAYAQTIAVQTAESSTETECTQTEATQGELQAAIQEGIQAAIQAGEAEAAMQASVQARLQEAMAEGAKTGLQLAREEFSKQVAALESKWTAKFASMAQQLEKAQAECKTLRKNKQK